MKKTLFIAVALMGLMTACSDGSMSLTEYNRSATAIYNPLDGAMQLIFTDFPAEAARKEQNLGKIKRCTRIIDNAKKELEKLKPPAEAVKLHQLLLHVISYEKDSMMPLFTHIVEASPDPETTTKLQAEVATASIRLNELVKEMQDEQQKVAAEAGATLR